MIANREIHVWIARTDLASDAIRADLAVLSDDERARAGRFRFEEDQHRSIVARATLRRVLGTYLSRSPQDLHFVFGPQGKPALADGALEFNVSHSGPLVLLAFAAGSPVGVDVEQEKPERDRLGIAQRFFAEPEVEKVRCADDVARAFYRTWTAKESVIKAVGGGLSIDLSSFLVTPDRGTFTAVENASGDERLTGWYVQTLPEPAELAHAAVAIRGEGWSTIVRHI
jgi:4'-phosphopantetheinyl transferase